MGITIKNILEDGTLGNGTLLAGGENINNEIKMVLILEVPSVLRWIKGGELLLTAGFVFKDDINMGVKLIRDLARQKIAGLVIKPGQYIKEIPQEMIDCAEEMNLPLIKIPSRLPYADIILPIFENIVSEQYSQLKRVHEVQEKFFSILLQGGDIENISHLLSSLIENPVLILDSSGNIKGKSMVPREEHDELTKALQEYLDNNPEFFKNKKNRTTFSLPWRGKLYNTFVVRVEYNLKNPGFIFVVEYFQALDQQDCLAIYQASTIIALELKKERAVFEAEQRLGSDLLEDILFGTIEDPQGIKRRASFLNFNLTQKKTVFVIRSSSLDPIDPEREFYLDNLKFDILKNITGIFKDYPGGILLSARRNRILGIINEKNPEMLEQILKEVPGKLDEVFQGDAKFYLGVGRTREDLKELRTSYKEALLCARVSEQLNTKITLHDQLGVIELLFELRNSPALTRYKKRYLDPIQKYDQKNKGELLKTLQAYFKNDLNLLKTAQELFIHKNTVNYRLQKIHQITGLNLKNYEDQATLNLALKADMVLNNR